MAPVNRIPSFRILAQGIGIALLALAGDLHAQTTNTWTAASGANFQWDTLMNWSLVAKPLATDDVLFPTPIPNPGSLASPGTIAVGTGEVANSLTINDAYTLTGGDLTLTTGNIAVPTGISAAIASVLKGSAGLTKTGTGTLILSGVNGYTGGTTIASNGGTLRIDNLSAVPAGAVTINSGGTLHLNGTGSTITLANDLGGSGILKATAPGTGSSTLQLSGNLSGFTGTVDVFPSSGGGGKLSLSTTTQGSLPSSSATIKVENGGTIYLPNALTYSSSFQLFGGNTGEARGQLRVDSGTVSGSVILMADSTIGVNSATGTISGPISESGGSFGFTKQAGGTLVLSSAANTYSGTTSIAAGTLSLTNGANRLPVGTTVNFTGTSNLNLNSNPQTVAGLSVSSGVTGTLQNGTLTVGAGTINFPGTTNTSTLTGSSGSQIAINGATIDSSSASSANGNARTVSATIVGTGGLILNGHGDTSDTGGGSNSSLNLSGANTFTGNVTINSGLVSASSGSEAAFGDVANQIVINGGGVLAKSNLTLSSTRSITLAGTGDRFFRAFNNTSLTINGVISGTGNLRKTDAGTLNLAGVNTYSGSTTIGGGTLSLTGGADRLPAGTVVSFTGGGTLNLNSNSQTVAGLSVSEGVTATLSNGTLTVGAGTITFPGSAASSSTLTGGQIGINGATIDSSSASGTTGISRTVSSAIVGTGGLTLNAHGDTSDTGGGNNSSLNLSGANTFTGNVTINSGLVYGNSDAAFGDVANQIVINGGGLLAKSNLSLPATRSITLGGSGDRYFRAYGGTTLTINGDVSGAGGLRKTDNGTLVLAGANTYTGGTLVGAGTLLVNGNISGATQVNTGSILGGAGTIGGATTVNSGGKIAPGSGIGTLNSGALTLIGSAQFTLEIDTTAQVADLLNMTGDLTLDLANSAVLALSDLGLDAALTPGTTLKFIDYSGTWNGGTFSGLPDDGILSLGVNQYQISYNGVSGTDTEVTLTAVPEPGALISVVGGMGLLLGLRRRRL